ncbi:MAG: gamma-glutamyltransferase [Alteromonas sp.]|nr:gamma-glutamyltransferase [Alteromonas sp.]MAY22895.1 gamma-glutamyltransferase [Flavobacteriaceae bacterium]
MLFLFLTGCKQEPSKTPETLPKQPVKASHAMVVSAREEASKIGVEVLKKGGNAFDAMIATEMALAVSYPYAGNLGGGGFMVYRTEFGELGSFDFREKAPLQASRDMFLDENGNFISEKSKKGALAVGVPGTIAGIFAVHEKLGSLPMEEILAPVIQLAEKGFAVTESQAQRITSYAPILKEVNGEVTIFNKAYQPGDTLKNKALAQTLQRIVNYGRAEFYEGQTGKAMVKYVQSHGGIMTMEDLAAYEAKWREPIVFQYKDLKIISMGPPSSGGVCMGQILKMIAPFPLSEYGHNTTRSIQVLTEAERRAYADRSFYMGDPDFVTIPIDSLLLENYLLKRMETFSFDKATPSATLSYGTLLPKESTETTHYSIVDSLGNAVAVTTTLNAAYGSKLYVPELGFFLNNEMDDFSAKPGEPNMFGLIGGEANAIAPQKRMLSSMTPTIVEKDGKLWMVLGTPGGATIITSVLQTLLNVYEFKMNMQEAVDAPRFHHQWWPDKISLEPQGFPAEIISSLEAKGYSLDQEGSPVIGKVDAILIRADGTLEGGADRRGDDTAIGY